MVVKTTSFDDNPGGAASYNVEAVEPNWFDYRITARFQEAAEAVVFLRDVDGSLAQKYNDDSRDVYVGPGRLKIENPAATTVYDGRIGRAVHNKATNILTLWCKDWLSQLMDKRDTYDMRELLGTTSLYEGRGRSDVNYANTFYGHFRGVAGKIIYAAQADDGGAFTDENIAANEQTEDDMTLLPAVPAVNDAYYFGFEVQRDSFSLYISQAGDWVGTIVWEYWDGGAWTALSDFLPVTSDDRNFEVAGQNDFSWTVPGDWATVAVNGLTAYWIRARVSVYTGITTQPLGRNAWDGDYFFDDGEYGDDGGMAFAANKYDGMKLVFTTGMAGKKQWTFHTNRSTVSAGVTGGTDPEATWTDDDTLDSGLKNADWDLVYEIQTELGNNTPSDFYVHDSILSAEIEVVYRVSGVGNHSHLEIYDNDAPGYTELIVLEVLDHFLRAKIEINQDLLPFIVNSDGVLKIQFNNDRAGGNCTLEVKYLAVHITTETTGYSLAIDIDDTMSPNKLKVDTDLTAQATRVWEYIPYSIVKPTYKHIASDETPGGLVTDGGGEVSGTGPDPLVALTSAANIEHTSGFSLRRYEERTNLEKLQDLANIDKTAFWMPIGTVGLTWKSTFNDGAPPVIGDTDVISWNSGEYNFDPVYNEMHLYGPKEGGVQSFYDTADAGTDPGADSKVRYGVVRSKVVKNTGTTNRYELTQLGEALVERDEDVNLFLNADIRGFSSLRLGDEVLVTSTYLGLAAVAYVITFWEYTYLADTTTIRLQST